MEWESEWFKLTDDLPEESQQERVVETETMESEKKSDMPDEIPILPLEDNVLFPELVMPWVVHGEKWVKLINDAVLGDKMVGVLAVRPRKEETPGDLTSSDFYDVGVVGRISRMLKLPEEAVQILVFGLAKFRILDWVRWDPYPV
ncbi:MAG: LON peptidase substrate-binding domain-containing protein, partial [Candidatus Atribacteria bacterium]|nr:LON peptidase substrate-binding domain-containing protein [Candidatus Atribacteria bacterium]